MAKIDATDLIVKMNGIPIAHSTTATLNINQDLPDATTKDSDKWAEHIRGQRDWSIDVEGMVDYSSSFGVDELADMIISAQDATVEFATSETGDTKYTGTVDLSGLTQDAPMHAPATFSGSLVGQGILGKGSVSQ